MPVKHKLMPSNPDSETLRRLSALLVSEDDSASLAINRYNALCAALQDYSPSEEQIAYDLTIENWERQRSELEAAHALLRDIYGTCNLREMPSEHAICDISNAIKALLTASPAPEQDACTCPSGDGSLRHPCPRHPTITYRAQLQEG